MGYIGNQSTGVVYTNLNTFKGKLANLTELMAASGMMSGDLYITEDNNHAHMYTGVAWVDIGEITGPQGPQGLKGEAGDVGPQGIQGIQGIEGPQGPQGPGITSIARTAGDGSEGTTDTYTITYGDSSTSTFDVTNGTAGVISHITRTGGTGTAGTTDTYTAYADLAETQPLGSFDVYNGADGEGSGDMSKSVYDTNNNGKVDRAENADTVNGLTVETAVPVDAVFTDTVYDDTDVVKAPLGVLPALDGSQLTNMPDALPVQTGYAGKYLKTNGTAVSWESAQEVLVSGTSIKTINGKSVLGSGDLEIDLTTPIEEW